VRVFIAHGDRTNRNKARLKYVLDAWGFEKFLRAVEEELGQPLQRIAADAVAPRAAFDKLAHIGVHPQKQPGLNWVGVALKLGRLSPEQIRGLAGLAHKFGDGDIRLTVWQNLLISGVADENVAAVTEAIDALGLATSVSPLRAGLVACTGATGCRFAAAHTKESADEIAAYCEANVAMDTPVNVHLTGCHHSCAQHYIGDIGLIGARVPVNDEGDTVDGFNVLIGGGYGPDATIARELFTNVKATDAPRTVAHILHTYLDQRLSKNESFLEFSRRVDLDAFRLEAKLEAAE
jgi:ferredoxin-nitrite reductase